MIISVSRHAALYCIANRLKTPFGTAMQTFEEFEKCLKRLLRQGESSQSTLRIHIFLHFIHDLEKRIQSIRSELETIGRSRASTPWAEGMMRWIPIRLLH